MQEVSEDIFAWYLRQVTEMIPGQLEKRRVAEELRTHLEELAAEQRSMGMTEEAAKRKAVDAMGDRQELAERLGRVHCYDSAEGFRAAATVLWWGLFFCSFRIGSELFRVLEQLAALAAVLYAMFRLRTVNREAKNAYHLAYLWIVFMLVSAAVSGTAWRYAFRLCVILEAAASFLKLGFCWRLTQGAEKLLGGRESDLPGKLRLGLKISLAANVLAYFALLVGGELSDSTAGLRITVDSYALVAMTVTALLLAGLFAAMLVWSRRIKRALSAEDQGGVEPFAARKAVPGIAGIVMAASLIVLLPAAYYLCPVKGEPFAGASQCDAQYQRLLQRLEKECGSESFEWYHEVSSGYNAGTVWGIASKQLQPESGGTYEARAKAYCMGMLRQYLVLLPPQQLQELAEARWFQIVCLAGEDMDPRIDTLFVLAEYDDGRIWLHQFSAADSRLAYSFSDSLELSWESEPAGIIWEGEEKLMDPGQEPVIECFYEKEGKWYRYQEKTLRADESQIVSEYDVNRSSDKTACVRSILLQEPEGRQDRLLAEFICQWQDSWLRRPCLEVSSFGIAQDQKSFAVFVRFQEWPGADKVD